MKCKLCSNKAESGSRLCPDCNRERMVNASCARIFDGGGLRWSNVEMYSEANWIKSVRSAMRKSKEKK